MADVKLEKMRQLLREKEEKKNNNGRSSGGDKATYPYWMIPEKQTSVLRWLPDRDEDNPWFWVERLTIKLPFEGVVGGEGARATPVLVTVPCVDMFEPKSCPIIQGTKHLWDTNEALARKYWKKRTFIGQAFVVSSAFEESDLPENPIRRLYFGPGLVEKLEAGLTDVDMEYTPTDYSNGSDFKLKKTRKGDFNNYDTSSFSLRPRALAEAEQIALETHGLWNLNDFRGSKPDAAGMDVIKAMFKASMAGDPYDMESFGSYYKPYGAGGGSSDATPEGVDDFSHTTRNTGASLGTRSNTASNGASAVSDQPEAKTDDPSGTPQDLMAKLRGRTTAARAT